MVISGDPIYALELKEKKILQAYKSKEASSLAINYDKDGFWYPVWISNMVLVYNPAKYARRNVPESFHDFAYNGGTRGQVAMENPLSAGNVFASMAALKDKYGYEYFEALGRQEVKLNSLPDALAKLESGEYRVVMVPEEVIIKKREKEFSRLSLIYPDDGIIVVPAVIMTINDRWSANRNLKAAAFVTDWFLSPNGQNYTVAGWTHAARAGFPKLPYDSITTNLILERSIPINWENSYRQKAEIRAKLEQFVTKK
jgi:iron(III) transport system substrate-binding protein